MSRKIKSCFLKIIAAVCVFCTLVVSPFSASAELGFDFDEVAKSVFIIVSADNSGDNYSLGSGFAIDSNYIVTNAHVIIDQENIAIGCYSETDENNIGDTYVAELVSMDEDMDIAVLYVEDITLTPLTVADVGTIKEGDDVYAIGTPEGLSYTLTKGTVSSKLRTIDGVKCVQTDAAINSGNSGGPLLNYNGEVIGMNTWKVSSSENLGFAIRIDVISEYFEQVTYEGEDGSYQEETPSDYDTSDYDYPQYYPNEGPSSSNAVYLAFSIIGVVAGIVVLIIKLTLRNKVNEVCDIQIPLAYEQSTDSENTVPLSAPGYVGAGIQILTGSMSGMQIEMTTGDTVIVGKDAEFANLVLDSTYRSVSRVHCSITYDAKSNKYFVIDSSSNGTYFASGFSLPKNTRVPVAKGTVLMLADDNCKIKLI